MNLKAIFGLEATLGKGLEGVKEMIIKIGLTPDVRSVSYIRWLNNFVWGLPRPRETLGYLLFLEGLEGFVGVEDVVGLEGFVGVEGTVGLEGLEGLPDLEDFEDFAFLLKSSARSIQ